MSGIIIGFVDGEAKPGGGFGPGFFRGRGFPGVGPYPWFFHYLPGVYLRQGNPGPYRAPIGRFWALPDQFHAKPAGLCTRVFHPGRLLCFQAILAILLGLLNPF